MLDPEHTVEIRFIWQTNLFHLSKGTKNERHSSIHPIKRIEVRKLNLKVIKVTEGTDIDLVREARNIGLLF
jgi:hypothetical protein